MKNRILICAVTTAVTALVFSASSPLMAKTLTGKWNGRSPTTLEFLDGNKVKYCYKKKCTEQGYTGDKDTKIKFTWRRAKFTFTKTDSGYDGSYLRVISSKVKVQ